MELALTSFDDACSFMVAKPLCFLALLQKVSTSRTLKASKLTRFLEQKKEARVFGQLVGKVGFRGRVICYRRQIVFMQFITPT